MVFENEIRDELRNEAVAYVADLQRAELERACSRLLAEGMPESQIAQLLQAVAATNAGRLAQVERDVAAALGQPPSIH